MDYQSRVCRYDNPADRARHNRIVRVLSVEAHGYEVQEILIHGSALNDLTAPFRALGHQLVLLADPRDFERGMRVRYTYPIAMDIETLGLATVRDVNFNTLRVCFDETPRERQLMAYKFWPIDRPEERLTTPRPRQLSLF